MSFAPSFVSWAAVVGKPPKETCVAGTARRPRRSMVRRDSRGPAGRETSWSSLMESPFLRGQQNVTDLIGARPMRAHTLAGQHLPVIQQVVAAPERHGRAAAVARRDGTRPVGSPTRV